MLLVGLTGGIGAGKSSVSSRLTGHGAVIIDADAIAREVVAPDGLAYPAVVDRFGSSVLRPDGALDRGALADLVFEDSAARKDLEAITHPAIGHVMLERIRANNDTDHVVVLDIPLLAEKGRMGVSAVIVVDCPVDAAVDRLVNLRNFDREDAQRRVAAQLSRPARLALADYVVDNSGTPADLDVEVTRLWEWLQRRRDEIVPSEAGTTPGPAG